MSIKSCVTDGVYRTYSLMILKLIVMSGYVGLNSVLKAEGADNKRGRIIKENKLTTEEIEK